ncbi:MAG: hypothetical protein WAV07_09110 [Candidatus Contendobacter sp.]
MNPRVPDSLPKTPPQEDAKPLTFVDYAGDDPVAFVVPVNLHRRHLNPSQLAMVGAAIKLLFEEQARARQQAAGGDRGNQYTGGKVPVSANLREAAETGKAAEYAAAAQGERLDMACATDRAQAALSQRRAEALADMRAAEQHLEHALLSGVDTQRRPAPRWRSRRRGWMR